MHNKIIPNLNSHLGSLNVNHTTLEFTLTLIFLLLGGLLLSFANRKRLDKICQATFCTKNPITDREVKFINIIGAICLIVALIMYFFIYRDHVRFTQYLLDTGSRVDTNPTASESTILKNSKIDFKEVIIDKEDIKNINDIRPN